MLAALAIRDFVLIEKLDLAFGEAAVGGLMALTGETGAGKSILIDAMGLALGARAEAGAVRRGAGQASVAAEFALDPEHPATAILAEQGMDDDGGRLVLRRVVGTDGRSRAFVNDQPASVGLLRRLGESLVEVQGQMEQHGLLDAGTHRDALDAFAGAETAVRRAAEAWRAWRDAETARAGAEAGLAQARREEDYLRHALAELDKADPRADDEETLAAERQALRHGAALGEALQSALGELDGGKGAAASLRAAHRAIERQADKAAGKLDAALAALDRAAGEALEAQAQLEAAQEALAPDPAKLERIEERLFALRALARKHSVAPAELPALRERIAAQIDALDHSDAHLKKLDAAAQAARKAYVSAAESLSATRAKAAAKLDRAVAAELTPLKLERARFATSVEALPETDWGPAGRDRVQFLVSTNPGQPPAPIARVASGGELSRFLLALKVSLARVGAARTLVFDEVDSGVGGATAAAVGERLRRLARDFRVLVVTHSPQVAAVADRHFLIRKVTRKQAAATEVAALDAGGRREEIARMLAGAEITAEARAAADRLLATAG